MNTPFIPENAPFSNDQRLWLGGFFAGLHSRKLAAADQGGAAVKSVTILYGTQTGNSESLCHDIAAMAGAHGMAAEVVDMAQFTVEQLAETERVLIVTSTYGEGEHPDNALTLWKAMTADNAPKLDKTFFSVLGLGDTSYDLFCQAAIEWDAQLQLLGATRVQDRVDCDVDFEEPAEEWAQAALAAITVVGSQEGAVTGGAAAAPAKEKSKYNKKNPFLAKLLKKRTLNKEGSSKEVLHYEISLEGSDIDYKIGDALCVYPTNCAAYASDLIAALGLDPNTEVEGGTLHSVFVAHYEIRTPSKELIQDVASKTGNSEFKDAAADKKVIGDWLWGRETIDVITENDVKYTAEEFLALSKKLQARAYSISSSPKKHEGEVHLTVGSVRYESHGRSRKGVASCFLADIVEENKTDVGVYLHANKAFTTPADFDAPMIMVGPGTGIAPFRSFLEEREMTEAKGKNWLLFGDRNSATDYLYEDELEEMKASGLLTKLSLAFSRDQEEKIYVQTKMVEHGAELFQWLEEGGYFFVCGDAFRMAKDVDKALHQVIATHGNLSEDQAAEYVQKLQSEKRYVRDVY